MAKLNPGNINGNEGGIGYASGDYDAVKDEAVLGKIGSILNILYIVIAVVAVAMIIYGGVNMITSSGDPGKVNKAKSAVIYGIIGMVIALLAFVITNFVLSAFK